MLRWVLRLLRGYALFVTLVVGVAMAASFQYGLDEDVRAWAAAHRPLTTVLLALGFLCYGMYIWLDEPYE